jgi:membrane protein YdbS with pleckstrin-like domain
MVRSPTEEVRLDERRHAVVLAGPFLRALALAVGGVAGFVLGWPLSAVGVVMLVLGALIAVRAVWRWERTHVVLTTEKLFVVHGTVRRRAAAVRLERVGAVEIEQNLAGRLLGYGTVVAGDLEITHVPEPRRLVERLSA